ncbi:hypothetical protein SCHPADRAFT_896069 [Schizopora paradoxa]|uniref:F-box domain-containing protein n=1 Tax=Schizopora paradoxa TaxID=27342 RepID=A0A0H2R1P0_9AGAM|nr:hypothetical protein SCHPADRAFT_896069 [Schizopora paradoxa]
MGAVNSIISWPTPASFEKKKRNFDSAFQNELSVGASAISQKRASLPQSTQRRRFPLEHPWSGEELCKASDSSRGSRLREVREVGVQTIDSNTLGILPVDVAIKVASFLEDRDFKSLVFLSHFWNTQLAPVYFQRVGILRPQQQRGSDLETTRIRRIAGSFDLIISTSVAFSHLMLWRRSQVERSMNCALFSLSSNPNDATRDLGYLKLFFASVSSESGFRMKTINIQINSDTHLLNQEHLLDILNGLFRVHCESLELHSPTYVASPVVDPARPEVLARAMHQLPQIRAIQVVHSLRSLIWKSWIASHPDLTTWLVSNVNRNLSLRRITLTNTGLTVGDVDKGLTIMDVPNLESINIEGGSFLALVAFFRRHPMLQHVGLYGVDEVAEKIEGFESLIGTLDLRLLRSLFATPSTAESFIGVCRLESLHDFTGIRFLLNSDRTFDTAGFKRFLSTSYLDKSTHPNFHDIDLVLPPLNRFTSPLFGRENPFGGLQLMTLIEHVILRLSTDFQSRDHIALFGRAISFFGEFTSIKVVTIVKPIGIDATFIQNVLVMTLIQYPCLRQRRNIAVDFKRAGNLLNMLHASLARRLAPSLMNRSPSTLTTLHDLARQLSIFPPTSRRRRAIGNVKMNGMMGRRRREGYTVNGGARLDSREVAYQHNRPPMSCERLATKVGNSELTQLTKSRMTFAQGQEREQRGSRPGSWTGANSLARFRCVPENAETTTATTVTMLELTEWEKRMVRRRVEDGNLGWTVTRAWRHRKYDIEETYIQIEQEVKDFKLLLKPFHCTLSSLTLRAYFWWTTALCASAKWGNGSRRKGERLDRGAWPFFNINYSYMLQSFTRTVLSNFERHTPAGNSEVRWVHERIQKIRATYKISLSISQRRLHTDLYSHRQSGTQSTATPNMQAACWYSRSRGHCSPDVHDFPMSKRPYNAHRVASRVKRGLERVKDDVGRIFREAIAGGDEVRGYNGSSTGDKEEKRRRVRCEFKCPYLWKRVNSQSPKRIPSKDPFDVPEAPGMARHRSPDNTPTFMQIPCGMFRGRNLSGSLAATADRSTNESWMEHVEEHDCGTGRDRMLGRRGNRRDLALSNHPYVDNARHTKRIFQSPAKPNDLISQCAMTLWKPTLSTTHTELLRNRGGISELSEMAYEEFKRLAITFGVLWRCCIAVEQDRLSRVDRKYLKNHEPYLTTSTCIILGHGIREIYQSSSPISQHSRKTRRRPLNFAQRRRRHHALYVPPTLGGHIQSHAKQGGEEVVSEKQALEVPLPLKERAFQRLTPGLKRNM